MCPTARNFGSVNRVVPTTSRQRICGCIRSWSVPRVWTNARAMGPRSWLITPSTFARAIRIGGKLLALASSTTFAAEAQTARTMAAELMNKHNISLGPGKPSQDTIERRFYQPFAKGMRWEGIIVLALADLCSCTLFSTSRRWTDTS